MFAERNSSMFCLGPPGHDLLKPNGQTAQRTMSYVAWGDAAPLAWTDDGKNEAELH